MRALGRAEDAGSTPRRGVLDLACHAAVSLAVSNASTIQRPLNPGPLPRAWHRRVNEDAAMVTLQFHVDIDDGGHASWSVVSPQLPSLYASAERLTDCRRLAFEVLDAAGLGSTDICYVLADN